VTRPPDHVRRLVAEIETEIGEDGRHAVPGGDAGRGDAPATRDGGDRDGAETADRVTGIEGAGPLSGPTGPVEDAVREILLEIGEDPDREGLRGTPDRVHRMYAELTAGYHVDAERLVNGAIYDVGYSEMVVVKEIPFYSLCEHHLLPFFGTAAVAYIPRGRVIGLSKIPRVVEMYARRLQVQERMTQQIADFLNDHLKPQGVGVVIEANHLCAVMRGIRKPGTVMTTASVLGLFRTRDRTRAEFYSHLARPGPSV
jgi:GTP cyclohydrolase IA